MADADVVLLVLDASEIAAAGALPPEDAAILASHAESAPGSLLLASTKPICYQISHTSPQFAKLHTIRYNLGLSQSP